MITSTRHVSSSGVIKGSPTRRALFFAEYFPPYMGSDRRIFDLARHIDDWQIEFAVVPPLRILGGRCEQALEEYFRRHFIEGVAEDESGGIRGHYFVLPSWLLRCWRSLPMPVAYALTLTHLVLTAVRYVRSRKPDIIVVSHPSYLCGTAGLLAAHLTGTPALLDYPDAWTPLAIETACIPTRGLTARILHYLECAIARSAKRIVSITGALTAYIRGLGARCPIDIVGNGADRDHFDAAAPSCRSAIGLSDDHEVVLYSGRLEPWSGVHDIVEAIAIVCAERPNVRFVFVGDGSASARLTGEVAQRGLCDNVVFLGFQPFGQMPQLVAAADVAIVPFPHTPTTAVCSPVKLFEYLLMRKAVITTDLAGVRESVDERHVVFLPEFSAQQLSQSLLELLNDPQRRRRLAEAGYELCLEHHSWTNLARAFSRSMAQTASRVNAG